MSAIWLLRAIIVRTKRGASGLRSGVRRTPESASQTRLRNPVPRPVTKRFREPRRPVPTRNAAPSAARFSSAGSSRDRPVPDSAESKAGARFTDPGVSPVSAPRSIVGDPPLPRERETTVFLTTLYLRYAGLAIRSE